MLADINLHRRKIGEHPRAFCKGFLCEQHPAHIRMNDDGISNTLGIFWARQRTHLQAFARVSQGFLPGSFRQGQALGARTEPRKVHKGEHAIQAFVGFTQQGRRRTIKIQHAGSITVNAHLVLNRTTVHMIGSAQATVGVHLEFGHDKQRYTFGAGRCIRQAG